MVDIRAFAKGDVGLFRAQAWKMPSQDASRLRSFLLKHIRGLLVAVYPFRKDRCLQRVSALTLDSLFCCS